jgi:hypothetical protein
MPQCEPCFIDLHVWVDIMKNLGLHHHVEGFFLFDVCSEAVSFLIATCDPSHLKSLFCYFDLWGAGGPNWQREEKLWYLEQENEWTVVQRRQGSWRLGSRFFGLQKSKQSRHGYLHYMP